MFVFDRYTHPHLHIYWADCGMFDPDLHEFVRRITRGALELQQENNHANIDASFAILSAVTAIPFTEPTLLDVMLAAGGWLFSLRQKGGVGCLLREAERERDRAMQAAQDDALVAFFQQACGVPELPAWYDMAREYARRTPGGGLYVPEASVQAAFRPDSAYTGRQILLINRDGTMSIWEGREARSASELVESINHSGNPFSEMQNVMLFYYTQEWPLIYEYSGVFTVDEELAAHALIMEGDIRCGK